MVSKIALAIESADFKTRSDEYFSDQGREENCGVSFPGHSLEVEQAKQKEIANVNKKLGGRLCTGK